jgi:ATP-dependent helicase/nuclease subunit A
VLSSPGHDLSLARALKSPLFGVDDAGLLWLAQTARAAGQTWLDALLSGAAGCNTGLAPELQRAAALLADWRQAAAYLPPHDLLDRIVHQGELPARLAAVVPAARRAAALQAVDALLAAALVHQGGRFMSVYAFVRELRAGRVPAQSGAPADAVQLLTVHGAKGLEARAVVLVDTDPEPRASERATLLVDWPVQAAAPQRVAFVRSASAVPPSLAALAAEEQDARDREELNGLYVALSRAKEQLVFSRTEPSRRGAGHSWWQRLLPLAQAWVPVPPLAAVGAESIHVPTLPALIHPAARVAPEVNAAAARLGQAVHRVLEWAGRPGAPLPTDQRPAACTAAALAFGLPAATAARVLSAVNVVLNSPACAGFFDSPTLRWAGNEVPLAWQGQILRIDRLVLLSPAGEPPVWWVLDYKLQHAPGEVAAYREQLQRYVQAVQANEPGTAVRGAFITGRGQVVEV